MPYKKCKYCGDYFWSIGPNDNVCTERCAKQYSDNEREQNPTRRGPRRPRLGAEEVGLHGNRIKTE